MKTNVIMRRGLFDGEVGQRTDNSFFSATDLMKVGNSWRVANKLQLVKQEDYFRTKSAKEFVETLKNEFGKVKISGRGRGHHTWVHPLLFIDMALWINPKLKIEVYKWLYDELIKYRLYSGDSYKKMCGILFLKSKRKDIFPKNIKILAKIIKNECGVKDWQEATEAQLRLRDKIHENIALLADVLNDNQTAIRIGLQKAKEEFQ